MSAGSSPGTEEQVIEQPAQDTSQGGAGAGASDGGVAQDAGKVAGAPGEADAGKQDKGGAEASAADDGGGKPKRFKNALEAVQASLAASEAKKEGKSPSPATQSKTEGQDDSTKTPPKKTAANEDEKLPFSTHPRFKEITAENRTLRVAHEKNEARIKELEPRAKATEDLSSYLRDNNLNRDDFANTLTIMALVRNDPIKAYEVIKPIFEQLEAAAGIRLPADLQKLVEDGRVDEATARELARTRGEKTVLQTRMADQSRRSEESETRTAQEQAQAVENEVVAALNQWEKDWLTREPDAARIKPFLEDVLLLKANVKPPMNAEEARALAEECVKEVKQRLRTFIPTPAAKGGGLPPGTEARPVPSVPTSALEAAKLALAGAGG